MKKCLFNEFASARLIGMFQFIACSASAFPGGICRRKEVVHWISFLKERE